MVWCVEWLPRKQTPSAPRVGVVDLTDPQYCAIQRQASPPPTYRDGLATLCGHWVICTTGISEREPTCEACREALGLSEGTEAPARRARSLEGL
jgi:hypothetical protein